MEISGNSMVSGVRWLSISAFAKMILGLILNVMLARMLGVYFWGILSVTLILVTLAVQFCNLTLNSTITYFTSKFHFQGETKKVRDYISVLFKVKSIIICLLAILFFFLSPVFAVLFHVPSAVPYFQMATLYLIGMSFFNTFQALFYGLNWFKTNAIIDFSANILKFVFAFSLLILGFGLNGVVFGMAMSMIIPSLLMAFLSRHLFTLNPAPIDRKKVVSYNIHLSATQLFGIAMMWTDSIIIGLMMGSIFVGFYNIAITIIVSLSTIFSTLTNVLMPSFVSMAQTKSEKIQHYVNNTLYYGLFLAVPMMFGLIITAPYVVIFFFGSSYSSAVIPLALLSYVLVDTVIMSILSSYFIAIDKPQIISKSVTFASILNVVLNIILIPLVGLLGAAIASVSSKIIILIIFLGYSSVCKLKIHNKNFMHPFISSVVMVVVLHFVKNYVTSFLTLFMFIGLGMLVYAGIQFLFGFKFKKFFKIIFTSKC